MAARSEPMMAGSAATSTRSPTKARCAADCQQLEQLPNIGPSLAGDLRSIGIDSPQQLRGADAFQLYQRLCQASGRRHDPCVLDTFLAITDFMAGAPPAPWWRYTADRKLRFGSI
ncbi:helix-hairpin-helix domain-containing protein [Piscinibacter sakaiensis]|uniref:helix-hairpin-helix domain-containing protein n=1 Tax=Piscinibacter sakaiensis TaxID=1547922 RepID=UPI003AAB038B